MPTVLVILDVPGTSTWTPPVGVTLLDSVEVWSGAGGGFEGPSKGGRLGAGGGGAAYSASFSIHVDAGVPIDYHIGTGGTTGVDGEASWMFDDKTIYAEEGYAALAPTIPGTGGQAVNGFGDTKTSGGTGGQNPSALNGSGGGGGAGGSEDNGTNGGDGTIPTGGTAGVGGFENGGNGAVGVAATALTAGIDGDVPGGGGSGGGNTFAGGRGGHGRIRIAYEAPAVVGNGGFFGVM